MKISYRMMGCVMSAVLIGACSLQTAHEQVEESEVDGIRQPITGAIESHCVLNPATKVNTCYPTFTAAIAAATGGRIADAPSDVKAALADQALTERINAASTAGAGTLATVIGGIFYDQIGQQGSSITVTKPSPCDADKLLREMWVDYPMLNAIGWNDRISSFHGYNNCWCKLWEHDRSGKSYGFVVMAELLYDFDNIASSIDFT
jgi:hypothetical protein